MLKYYSQTKQDKIVDILFKQKMFGNFIDIGAHDGISFSNSYFFEQSRKWTGICIEPIPEVFEILKKNRNCTLVNGAISDNHEIIEFKRMHGYSEMLSGIVKHRDSKHDERTKNELEKYGGKEEIIKVQAYTLSELLDMYNISTIDYMSIDIEGGEYEILKTIDFTKTNINCLTVENNYNDTAIRNYMKENDFYFLFCFGADDFYIKKNKFSLITITLNRAIRKLWWNYWVNKKIETDF
jgi:FkbM family methyltransferase